MTLLFTLTLTVLLQRNSRLFPVLLLSSLTLNAAKSSIPFGRIKRHLKAWWSAKVEEAASERRKAFAAAHRSDEDRQTYISAFPTCFVCHRQSQFLRHGKRLALLSHLNLRTPSFVLLAHLSPLLTSPTVPLPGSRLQSSPIT